MRPTKSVGRNTGPLLAATGVDTYTRRTLRDSLPTETGVSAHLVNFVKSLPQEE